MIETPRAIDGEPQESLAGGGDHVLQFLLADARFEQHARGGVASLIIRPGHQKAGRNDAVARDWLQSIPSDLLFDELKVGLVVVETPHYVVPVTPGMFADFVVLESLAFGEPRHIQPMPRPSFAVLRRGEQAVHYSCERLRGLIGEKGFQLGRGGREAGQVKSSATQERRFVGHRRWRNAFLLQFGEDEIVQRLARAASKFDLWNLG